jgi:hypothetical protein
MTKPNAHAVPLTSSEHQVQLRRAVIASTVGTAIEWYDFFLYSTVTGLVFAKLFFPRSDPGVGTLEAFAIYAVGFVARPPGASDRDLAVRHLSFGSRDRGLYRGLRGDHAGRHSPDDRLHRQGHFRGISIAVISSFARRDVRGPPSSRQRNRTSNKEMAMGRTIGSLLGVAALAAMLAFQSGAGAQTAAPPTENAAPTADNAILLTIFLKHDQSRPLSELNAQLEKQGFYKAFPPPGIEVVSWYVMMGIGQVITLRLPASRLREVNRVLEDTAWGSYRTEFYPTYDYKAAGMGEHDKAR